MHLWLCVFVVSPGRWFFRLKSSLWSYPWPIGSKYGLFTYMNGEKWPHSRGKWLGKYSRPMDVSENNGTPKSSIFIGFSIINHPFWGTPIFGNTHMDPMGHGFHPRPPAKIRPPPAWKYPPLPGRKLENGFRPYRPYKISKGFLPKNDWTLL